MHVHIPTSAREHCLATTYTSYQAQDRSEFPQITKFVFISAEEFPQITKFGSILCLIGV